MARTTKGKWLTKHDLRSGLKEQWASEHKTVELFWDRGLDKFVVTTQYAQWPGEIFASIYDSLADAREQFDGFVKRNRQPQKGASR